MNIGAMNKRVTISNPTRSQDEAGQSIEAYATATTVWAAVMPMAQTELISAQQAQSVATIKVRMRYNTSVTSQSRLTFGTRTLEVVGDGINPLEKNQQLTLLCKEVN